MKLTRSSYEVSPKFSSEVCFEVFSAPTVVAVYYVTHRLALACSQAGEKVAYVQKFKKALTTLYCFFSGQCSVDSRVKSYSGSAQ